MGIIDKPIENPDVTIYSIVREFSVAEVTCGWDSELKVKFPDEWESFDCNNLVDGSIRLWLSIHYPSMYQWLCDSDIDWIGLSYSEFYGHELQEILCVRMHKIEDVTEFRLKWC